MYEKDKSAPIAHDSLSKHDTINEYPSATTVKLEQLINFLRNSSLRKFLNNSKLKQLLSLLLNI